MDIKDPVLLYDGVCGFCNKSVQLILKLDRQRKIKFAPLQSTFGESVCARHEELKGIDSVVLVENAGQASEKIYVRSSAALRIAHYIGGFWRIFLIGYILPASIRDLLYDLIARNRYRFFGRYDTCMMPSPEVRSRFIDLA